MAVAIKVIRPGAQSDATAAKELEQRFKRELVLARQVTHKYVVRIHDLGEIDGIKYLTMTYIDGEDLSQLLSRNGRLPLPRALAIAREVGGKMLQRRPIDTRGAADFAVTLVMSGIAGLPKSGH